MASIESFGFNTPVLVDNDNCILGGHCRVVAATRLRLPKIPTVCLGHLSDAKKRAFILADNKIAELAGWDSEILRSEFEELLALDELDFSIESTGFSTTEIDALLELPGEAQIDPQADSIPEPAPHAVSRIGDIWTMGQHRLLVGDARDSKGYRRLLTEGPAPRTRSNLRRCHLPALGEL